MDTQSPQTWLIGIVSAIILGSLGSGLWSLLLEPIVKRTGKLLFKIFTLGIRKLSDGFYVEVSKRYREKGVRILIYALSFVVVIPTIWVFVQENRLKVHEEYLKQAIKIVESRDNDISEEKFEKQVQQEISKIILENTKYSKYKITLLAVFMFSIVMSQHLRSKFVDEAISQFDRAFNLCLPYFNDNEEKVMMSLFASIQTRSDYIEIMLKLEEIAQRGNKKIAKTFFY